MLDAFRSAARVANGTAQIARVSNLHKRQARMLLMVRAQPAIVWAAPFHSCVERLGHFRRFDEELTATAVIIHIVCDKNAFGAMLGAALQQKHFFVLKDDLAFELPKAP